MKYNKWNLFSKFSQFLACIYTFLEIDQFAYNEYQFNKYPPNNFKQKSLPFIFL